MRMTKALHRLTVRTMFLAAAVMAAGVVSEAQQYDYISPSGRTIVDISPTPTNYPPPTYTTPSYNPPCLTTPTYTPPSYYTPTYYNAACRAESFSLETDERVLKDMFNNKKCIYLEWDEIPNFDAYHVSDCYYKRYGVSCSSVNSDCQYVDISAMECNSRDGSCEVVTEYWNRPMKIDPYTKTEAIPITYASIDTARDVIVEYADQKHTSIKPVKDRYTFRHGDTEMWWREVYYLCTQGTVSDRTKYFNKKRLVSQEECPDERCGLNQWVRGEVGHDCRCEARLGYYYYMGEREHEAEWTLPEEAPERWREYVPGTSPSPGLDRWRFQQ